MQDFNDFDFHEFCEEERDIELQKQSSTPQTPQDNKMPTGAIIGTIIAIIVIVLIIVFSDFLVPIVVVGGIAYLFVKWLLG